MKVAKLATLVFFGILNVIFKTVHFILKVPVRSKLMCFYHIFLMLSPIPQCLVFNGIFEFVILEKVKKMVMTHSTVWGVNSFWVQ